MSSANQNGKKNPNPSPNNINSQSTNGGNPQIQNTAQQTPPPSNNAPKYGTLVPNRIFVGGISANTTEGELLQLFSSFGTVKAAKIIQDRAGVSKGYGFVTFESEDDAKRPLKEADNIVLRERKLNIAPAIKKQQTYGNRPFETQSTPIMQGNNPPYYFPGNVFSGYGPHQVAYMPAAQAAAGPPPDPAIAAAQQANMFGPPMPYHGQPGNNGAGNMPTLMLPQVYIPQPPYLVPTMYSEYAPNTVQPNPYMLGNPAGAQAAQMQQQPPNAGSPRNAAPPCYGPQPIQGGYGNDPSVYYNMQPQFYGAMENGAQPYFSDVLEMAGGNYEVHPGNQNFMPPARRNTPNRRAAKRGAAGNVVGSSSGEIGGSGDASISNQDVAEAGKKLEGMKLS